MTTFSTKPEDPCSILPERMTKANSATNLYIKHTNIYISRSSSLLPPKQTPEKFFIHPKIIYWSKAAQLATSNLLS